MLLVGTGQIVYKGRLVLPSFFSLIPSVLEEFYSTSIGGHENEIKKFEDECPICQ